jgi:HPt (histidine-containing phosphotransfer) domain-containing protein
VNEDPVLDPLPVQRLTETLGEQGPALVAELLAVFAEDAPVQLADLRSALDCADADAARRAAHSLKSTAAMLGAVRLAAAAGTVEARAHAGDLPGAAAALPTLAREYTPAAAALARLGAGQGGPGAGS